MNRPIAISFDHLLPRAKELEAVKKNL